MNILLAEDNPGDVLLIREALREHHVPHELKVVTDGEEALNYVSGLGMDDDHPCPDLVLLDLNLPKVQGADVLKELRNHGDCRRTPVIVVTSSDNLSDRAKVASRNIARYFRKPMQISEYMKLGHVVEEVLAEQI